METEATVLNDRIIAELLNRHYGLFVTSVEKMNIGSANCYRVFAGEKKYFLKEFQSFFSKDELVKEATLVNFLFDKGFPVARFYTALDGEVCISYLGHFVCVQEYLDGKIHGSRDLPPALLAKAANMLGRLHHALKDYPLPEEHMKKWLAAFSVQKCIKKFDELLVAASTMPEDKYMFDIVFDLQYKKGLAMRCEEYIKYFDRVTSYVVHGDYQGVQLICDDDDIKGVVDFSTAKDAPLVWEIMRSYVNTSHTARKKAKVDVEEFKSYVGEYLKYNKLSKYDLEVMPYIYITIAMSETYGYAHYLKPDMEFKQRLLDAALWRTAICKEIDRKAEDISKVLSDLVSE